LHDHHCFSVSPDGYGAADDGLRARLGGAASSGAKATRVGKRVNLSLCKKRLARLGESRIHHGLDRTGEQPMTNLDYSMHPAEFVRRRSSLQLARRTAVLTFAVAGSLTTATVIMVAALAGSL
jgi:hypothetical protein